MVNLRRIHPDGLVSNQFLEKHLICRGKNEINYILIPSSISHPLGLGIILLGFGFNTAGKIAAADGYSANYVQYIVGAQFLDKPVHVIKGAESGEARSS